MRVLRYALELNDNDQSVPLPSGSKVIHVACRRGEHSPSLWAIVPANSNDEARPRYFRVVGTGHYIPEGRPLAFVGTAHADIGALGALVWHVFEVERG